jgi:hypothetical protein
MSKWLETEDGEHINLDHVRRISEEHVGTASYRFRLELADDSHGVTPSWSDTLSHLRLGNLLATILPAAPGQEALHVGLKTNHGRPIGVWFKRYPIVGWRVHPDLPEARPVLPVLLPLDARLMIVLPCGQLIEQFWGEGEYDNIEDMTAQLLAEEQASWDEEYANEAAE